jgi:hypothetical protein
MGQGAGDEFSGDRSTGGVGASDHMTQLRYRTVGYHISSSE